MANKNNRPVFQNKIYDCKFCGSKDTVALDIRDSNIIWCECGKVTAIDYNHAEKEIFNFLPKVTKPYFAIEE